MSKEMNEKNAKTIPNEYVRILSEIDEGMDLLPMNKPFVQLVLDENTIVANALLKVGKGQKHNPRRNRDNTTRRRRTNIDIVEDRANGKTKLVVETIQFSRNPQNNDREAVGFEICNSEERLGRSYVLVKSLEPTVNYDSLSSNGEKIKCFIPMVHLAEDKVNHYFFLQSIVKIPAGFIMTAIRKIEITNERIVELHFDVNKDMKKDYFVFLNFVFEQVKGYDFVVKVINTEKPTEENKTMVGEEDADERDDSIIDL